MKQGPNSTFPRLIEQALQAQDIESAIEHISYSSTDDAHGIYDVIFSNLFKGKLYYLKDIKTLTPMLWLAFLNRDAFCSEIGPKKLRKILKKIIPILQKLDNELTYDPKLIELITLYNRIVHLIASNNEFIDSATEGKSFLRTEHKDFILQRLQSIPEVDEEVVARYENAEEDNDLFIPSNVYADDLDDSSDNGREPTYDVLKDPNLRRRFRLAEYLKVFYKDDAIQKFILSNQDGFLLSIDPFNLNKYVFSSSIFTQQEKMVVLKILIHTLESTDKEQKERAHNIIEYLLCNNKEVFTLFTKDLSGSLNIPALLLLSVCSLDFSAPLGVTPKHRAQTLRTCLLPLGQAMRECLAKRKTKAINDYFSNVNYLDRLCSLYSFCDQTECQSIWMDFWKLNNLLGDYNLLHDAILNHYPQFLYRRALSHLTLSKNDSINQQIAIDYLVKAVHHGYALAYLALAAIYAKRNDHQRMKTSALTFLTHHEGNQAIPKRSSTTYRFLFEVYYTYSCHFQNDLNAFSNELNRVYPEIVEAFNQAMSKPLFVKKLNVIGNDLRDPISILRERIENLKLNVQPIANIEVQETPAVLILNATQQQASVQNVPYYNESPLPSIIKPRK